MKLHVHESKPALGRAAAAQGAEAIRQAIAARGRASVIVATGASQFDTLAQLAAAPDVRWDRVTVFHLDEYAGIAITHPASFRLYLWDRFHSQLPLPVAAFHYLDLEQNDPRDEARRVSAIIRDHEIDVAMVGIGENGHLAFNDPPADFDTDEPYIVVKLDEACRRQQVGEGWFKGMEDVPTEAVSMSVKQIMKSRLIVVSVPDERKAEAVRNSVEGAVTPDVPASILQQHANTELHVDGPAASLLKQSTAATRA
ncbi:MAG: glucosamine-6-phosphate deaminase [Phycisphaeraceae bacterium]